MTPRTKIVIEKEKEREQRIDDAIAEDLIGRSTLIGQNEFTTPIFSPETGKRMGDIRMKMDLTQAELGKLLGVSQNSISKIEKGQLNTLGFMNHDGHFMPVTMSRFMAVFGKDTAYILKGSNKAKLNTDKIRSDYRSRINQKKGNRINHPQRKHPV